MVNDVGPRRRRRSIRLKDYDYAQDGAYYITICTHNREGIFGEIMNGVIRLGPFGEIAFEEWLKTEQLRSNVELDEFVIMPNHIHGIVVINRPWQSIIQRSLDFEKFGKPVSFSIPTIIRSYESAVTYRVNQLSHSRGGPVWQERYYEHIIRNEIDFNKIREYIMNNPSNWPRDRYHL